MIAAGHWQERPQAGPGSTMSRWGFITIIGQSKRESSNLRFIYESFLVFGDP